MEKTSNVLHSQLGLSPYESRAYVALMSKTSLNPSELTSLTGIPRPRTYDVLRGLVSKGLAVEQSGRPVRYSAVDPRQGLLGLYGSFERESHDQLGHLHKIVDKLALDLGRSYDESRREAGEEQRIWVTGSSNAVWAQFLFLKQHCKREYLGVTTSNSIPPYRIFLAEQEMLDRGVAARLVRPFSALSSKQQLNWYRDLMKKGFKLRQSDHNPFSFDIFDNKEIVLWLNDRPSQPPSEIAWVHHPPLARVLRLYFEEVWSNASLVHPKLFDP